MKKDELNAVLQHRGNFMQPTWMKGNKNDESLAMQWTFLA